MVRIVVDSTAYLPRKLATSWGVRVVPLSYIYAGEMYPDEFVEDLPSARIQMERYVQSAKTSQPAVKAFIAEFSDLRREGHDIVCITLSSRLSGTHSCACVAAKQVDEANIEVVDSLTTAYGMYLMCERAVSMAARGKSKEEIKADLLEMRNRIGLVMTVDTLEPLQRGGRLNMMRQSLSTLFNTKPILTLTNGIVLPRGVSRNTKSAIKDMADMIPGDATRIGIMHVAAFDKLMEFTDRVSTLFPKVRIEPWEIGPVVGIHVGPGTVGVAWLR